MLRDAKYDTSFWANLSSANILRLDYKSFRSDVREMSVGMSTALIAFDAIVAKHDLCSGVLRTLYSQHLALLVINTSVIVPHPKKDFVVFSSSHALLSELRTFLEDSSSTGSRMGCIFVSSHVVTVEPQEQGQGQGRIEQLHYFVFDQKYLPGTRKQAAPEMIRFLELASISGRSINGHTY